MIHTAVVLPPDLVERLKIDAHAHNRGLSAEIWERLRRTYREAAEDAETTRLLAAVRKLSNMLARDLGANMGTGGRIRAGGLQGGSGGIPCALSTTG